MICDDQEEVTDFLGTAQSYGIEGKVERIETHAAFVFLAGDYAFKLKRAVKLPYLDFSTAEKRRNICKAELQLNRRTAPELYLEVRPVRRKTDGCLSFNEGKPIDWLLVMRRFPTKDRLDEVAKHSGLNVVMVRQLADNIADFHEHAAVNPDSRGAGRVRKIIAGNQQSMAALPKDALPKNICDTLHFASLSALEKISSLLDRRARGGFVRHCHGDLHLENICLWKGQPTLFDCLEFDVELATIDVLYDLAFLLMDMWTRGYRTEACHLFNRYCDVTDDAAGLAAFPLFLSMRAAIRAHVSATAAKFQSDARSGAKKLAEARTYLSASLAYLDPSVPELVAIGGVSGTGKSTIAGTLASRLGRAPGARWLRSDVIRKRMAGVIPEKKLPSAFYTAKNTRAVYKQLRKMARSALSAGHSVIVDAAFTDPEERVAIAAVAQEIGVSFTGIWLEAPRETLIRRVEAREDDASDANSTVVERQLSYEIGNLEPWRIVDASGSPCEVASKTCTLLGL